MFMLKYPGHFIILEYIDGGDLGTDLSHQGWYSEPQTR